MRSALLAGFLLTAPAEDPTFTFDKADAKLGDVLDELTAQTGVAIDRDPIDADRTLTLRCDRLGFWAALEQIARDSDHRIQFGDRGRKIALAARGGYRQLPVSFDGRFRVAVRRVTATIDLAQDRQITEVGLEVNWLPGSRVFLLSEPAEVTAIDPGGLELALIQRGGGRIAVSGGGVNVPVRLADVPRSARSIRKLEGSLAAIGSSGMLDVEFADLAAAARGGSLTVDDVTVRVRGDCKTGDDLWSIRVELEYPEGGPVLESFESTAWLVENDVTLVARDGSKRLGVNGGYELVGGSERRATVIYRFTEEDDLKLGRPGDWKLIVRTPEKLRETKVKFALENIPLP